jgi:hypothetical protein
MKSMKQSYDFGRPGKYENGLRRFVQTFFCNGNGETRTFSILTRNGSTGADISMYYQITFFFISVFVDYFDKKS